MLDLHIMVINVIFYPKEIQLINPLMLSKFIAYQYG